MQGGSLQSVFMYACSQCACEVLPTLTREAGGQGGGCLAESSLLMPVLLGGIAFELWFSLRHFATCNFTVFMQVVM